VAQICADDWRLSSVQHLLRTISIPFGLLLLTAAGYGCSAVPDMLTHGAASPAPTDVAAQRPEATLTIAQPPAGATLPSGKVTVVVSYNGPSLVAAAQATELNQYHLDYLLDVNPAQYLKTNVIIPLGNPSIIHTDKTQVNFDNVAPGSHLLAVILTGSNHVSPTKPVAQQISFTAT
jgi:hypothetical protein